MVTGSVFARMACFSCGGINKWHEKRAFGLKHSWINTTALSRMGICLPLDPDPARPTVAARMQPVSAAVFKLE